MRKIVEWILVLVLAMASLGVLTQAAEDESSELIKRVDALERLMKVQAHYLSLLEARIARLEKRQPQASVKAKSKPQASRKTQKEQIEYKPYKLKELLPVSSSSATKATGATVLGEVWVVSVEPGKEPSTTLFKSRHPTGPFDSATSKEGLILCTLEVPSGTGLRIRKWEIWRIQGKVQHAKYTPEKDGAGALYLHLIDVQGTRIKHLEPPQIGPTGGFYVR